MKFHIWGQIHIWGKNTIFGIRNSKYEPVQFHIWSHIWGFTFGCIFTIFHPTLTSYLDSYLELIFGCIFTIFHPTLTSYLDSYLKLIFGCIFTIFGVSYYGTFTPNMKHDDISHMGAFSPYMVITYGYKNTKYEKSIILTFGSNFIIFGNIYITFGFTFSITFGSHITV